MEIYKNKNTYSLSKVARIIHSLVREYNFLVYGENYPNSAKWKDLSEEFTISLKNAIINESNRPSISNQLSHSRWMRDRKNQGWKYSEVLDREKKLHPNLVPYKDLPNSEKFKDFLFKNLVKYLYRKDGLVRKNNKKKVSKGKKTKVKKVKKKVGKNV